MKKQITSFKNAIKGVLSTIKSEPHMRFHIASAFYVLVFAPFYGFTAGQYALLLVLIAMVLAAEILNTSIEQLCDFVADRYDSRIKVIKNAAAGVVLVIALAAFAVGIIFYLKIEVIKRIIVFFICNPIMLILFVLSLVFFVIFVWKGPVGIKAYILRIFKRKKL